MGEGEGRVAGLAGIDEGLAAQLDPGGMNEPGPTGPQWMDGPVAAPRRRTGVTPNPRSGLQSFLFLGGLVAFVAIAGLVGVALWGPDKQVTSRNHFASDPPPAQSLPSLPEDPAPAAEAQSAPTESAAPPAPRPAPKRAPRRPKPK